jgi:hypothetical protein
MTALPRPFHILFGALLSVFAAGTEANVGEYKWGKTVCTPTSSKVVRNLLNGSMETHLHAPAASCRCERDPTERERVEVRIDRNASTITITRIDEHGGRALWDQFQNCKIHNQGSWDCSGMHRGIDWIKKMTSDEGLFLATINAEVGALKGSELWGSCIRKDGWSLRGLWER